MNEQDVESLKTKAETTYQTAIAFAKKELILNLDAIDVVKEMSDELNMKVAETEMKTIILRGDKIHRQMALERAGNQCELCWNSYHLENHHVLPKSVYPQHRFNFFNSCILCPVCHNMIELEPIILTKHMETRLQFRDRLSWYKENTGIGKNPTEVDYEKQFKELIK